MAFAKINAMKSSSVSVDAAGRVVLPKPIRELLSLRTGSELRISLAGGSLVLTPARMEDVLVEEKGVWVHHGKAAGNLFAEIDNLRDERLSDLSRAALRR
jgi:AbrB family looped-hinge helix DNA binding protein